MHTVTWEKFGVEIFSSVQPTNKIEFKRIFCQCKLHVWCAQSSSAMSIRSYFKPKGGLPKHCCQCLPKRYHPANKTTEKAIMYKGLVRSAVSTLCTHSSLGCSKLFHTLPCCSRSLASRMTLPHAIIGNYIVKKLYVPVYYLT